MAQGGRRFTKQIIYGSGYAAILFLIGFFAYNTWFKPAPTCTDSIQNQGETGVDCGGPCSACAIKELFNLGIDQKQVKYFPADPEKKTTAFYFEIQNLNLTYAAQSFKYMLDVFDKNGIEITNSIKDSIVYAGGTTHIFDIINVPFDQINSASVATENLSWKLGTDFPKPDTGSRDIQITATSADGSGITMSGFAQNKEAYPLSKMTIVGVLYNKDNIIISASQTELDNVAAYSEMPFKINFPKNIFMLGTDETVYNFTQDLKIGSTGDDVKKLQGFLNQSITGQFDQATKDALTQYQKQRKLSATGILDSKTRNYINDQKLEMPKTLQAITLTKADGSKNNGVYVQGIK